ncbi:hypothetical protein [Fluviispira multicolorata]|uniref:Uncharacterized protein n=1 Tax=Fluviispira multicolorata TaxID=2654512 RepID=A0A833N5G5_9BACT|nr:hypothetical protein [Fluviispira multicolorata]KAB8033354.1 hypothetical protein GCL57_01245 [Fluviispira multicolorata]
MKNSTSDAIQSELIGILKSLNRSDLRLVNKPLYYKILEKFVNLLDIADSAREDEKETIIKKEQEYNLFQENKSENENKDTLEFDIQDIKPDGFYH